MAALTLRELEAEIATLERLITLADDVRRSGQDRKWEALSGILQDSVQEVEQDPAHPGLTPMHGTQDLHLARSEAIVTKQAPGDEVDDEPSGLPWVLSQ